MEPEPKVLFEPKTDQGDIDRLREWGRQGWLLVPKWVKCTEKPIPVMQIVLVWDGQVVKAYAHDHPAEDRIWEKRGITHWMPTPKPPTE